MYIYYNYQWKAKNTLCSLVLRLWLIQVVKINNLMHIFYGITL